MKWVKRGRYAPYLLGIRTSQSYVLKGTSITMRSNQKMSLSQFLSQNYDEEYRFVTYIKLVLAFLLVSFTKGNINTVHVEIGS